MSKRSLEDIYFPARFGCLEKRSATYQKTVQILQTFVEAEGIDEAQYAYATVVSDLVRSRWAKKNKVTLDGRKGHWCVRKILGETCRQNICGPTGLAAGIDAIPAYDHARSGREKANRRCLLLSLMG